MGVHKNKPQPLYRQLQDTLHGEIMSGALPPDALLPSERELCRRYAVSHMTVRLALAELEKDGLVVRVPGKGTFVASSVPAVADCEHEVGLIVGHAEMSEFIAALLSGVKRALLPYQTGLQLFYGGEERYFDMLAAKRLDGVIIADPLFHDLRLQRIKQMNVPAVVLGRPSFRRINSVDNDNVAVGRLQTEHLLACGCRRIGFLGGDRSFTVTQDRLAGYKSVLREAGMRGVRELISFCDYAAPDVEAGVRKLYEAGADGIVCADDFFGIWAMNELAAAGVAIGTRIRVCGCNDSQLASHHRPALTSVNLDIDRLAALLVENLQQQIAGLPAEERSLVPSTLVVRSSTVDPATS